MRMGRSSGGSDAFGYAAFMVYVDNEEVIYSFNTNGLYTLDGLAPGTYDVYIWNEFGSGLPGLEQPGVMYCTSAAQATVGSLPQPCGGISGRVYHDANEDCSFNGFDLRTAIRCAHHQAATSSPSRTALATTSATSTSGPTPSPRRVRE